MMDRSRSHGMLKGVEFNYEVMEEELTCPVCLELYADPLLLVCSHSVCKKCLQDIFDSKASGKSKSNDQHNTQYVLECPSCRREIKLKRDQISELPKNLALENIVIRYTEERSKSIRKSLSLESPISDLLFSPILDLAQLPEFPTESSAVCELCDNGMKSTNKAVWYCNTCSVAYCRSCLGKYHPNRGPLSRHRVTLSSDSDGHQGLFWCADHENEAVTMFCDDCQVPVCHLCVCEGEGKHTEHRMLMPEKACNKLKASVEETKSSSDALLGKLAEQRSKLLAYMDDIKTFHNQTVARIEQHYSHLVADITNALATEKSRIIKDLSGAHSKEAARVKDCLGENEKCGEALLDVSKECLTLLEERSQKETLSKAADIEPMKTTLQQRTQQTEDLTEQFESTVRSKATRVRLQTAVQDFREGATSVLSLFQDAEYRTIVPVVKTPTCMSPGRTSTDSAPRSPVQNKCLQTWGFTSTSFTGAELDANATWTVTIEKNTGHGGNFNTGCLFAVGVSSEELGIKDIVGSTDGTSGVVCSDGVLYFITGNSQHRLVALENLPLSLTLSLNMDHPQYTVLSYKLESASNSDCKHLPLEGRHVLGDSRLKEFVYPVFTVSQRVKLLFPTYV